MPHWHRRLLCGRLIAKHDALRRSFRRVCFILESCSYHHWPEDCLHPLIKRVALAGAKKRSHVPRSHPDIGFILVCTRHDGDSTGPRSLLSAPRVITNCEAAAVLVPQSETLHHINLKITPDPYRHHNISTWMHSPQDVWMSDVIHVCFLT